MTRRTLSGSGVRNLFKRVKCMFFYNLREAFQSFLWNAVMAAAAGVVILACLFMGSSLLGAIMQFWGIR